jgi:hypothetical protein
MEGTEDGRVYYTIQEGRQEVVQYNGTEITHALLMEVSWSTSSRLAIDSTSVKHLYREDSEMLTGLSRLQSLVVSRRMTNRHLKIEFLSQNVRHCREKSSSELFTLEHATCPTTRLSATIVP